MQQIADSTHQTADFTQRIADAMPRLEQRTSEVVDRLDKAQLRHEATNNQILELIAQGRRHCERASRRTNKLLSSVDQSLINANSLSTRAYDSLNSFKSRVEERLEDVQASIEAARTKVEQAADSFQCSLRA
eukprot:CAMPEP_0204913958 /NCGR_PEP_ID=MMETSP1397-20131031/11829_1 /ASSEMBLY_ACC=CAM_ASM_000891 /TAXON_ID=49980 /ORGANISM="Climacostomum Climacostomum virens, Strain Stock W-24" /LENGTH=131 /DNA_ID=CAMNT_0052085333 /DNA_START=57 /DNA_END=452 /DNA_ORIENTATION=+